MREFIVRLRVILIALMLMTVATAFLVVPERVAEFANELARQEDNLRRIMAAAAMVINIALFFIIYQEIRLRPRTSDGLFVPSKAHKTEVSLESIRTTLNNQLLKLEHIRGVNTKAVAEKGRLALEIEITADENLNIRKATQQIHREVTTVIDRQMGLRRTGKPTLKFFLGDSLKPAEISKPTAPAKPSRLEFLQSQAAVGTLNETPLTGNMLPDDATIQLKPDEDRTILLSSTDTD